jgi:signal transduction histidine kinase
VRLDAVEGRAVLQVADTGEGIPAGELSRVFERFYRVDKARTRQTGGTGLGLAIVRHVAEAHGGRVRVDSELGAGSTFTVTLPVAGPPAS